MAKKSQPKPLKKRAVPESPAQRAARLLQDGKTLAAVAWAKSIAPTATNLDDLWIAGKILAQSGEVDEAIARFISLQRSAPAHPEVGFMLVCCQASQGNVAEALSQLDLSELGAAESALLANACTAGGKLDQALRILETARQRIPDSAELDLELADLYTAEGQYQRASELLQLATQHPTTTPAVDARVWFNLGVLLEMQAKSRTPDRAQAKQVAQAEPAEQVVHSVQEVEPNSASSAALRSESLPEWCPELAYRKAIDFDASYRKPWINLAVLMIEHGRLNAALELLATAYKHFADDDKLSYLRAFALRLNDDFEEAIQILQMIVSRSQYAEAWELLGRLLTEQDRHEEAIRHYQRWLSVKPQQPIATHLLAAITGQAVPSRATAAYVTNTFDNFAETFEAALLKLEYRGPAIIQQLLEQHIDTPEVDGAPRFSRVLDAGCGTGLAGPILRDYARELVGIDLSPAMLQQAALKKVYDKLLACDLETHLKDSVGQYELIVAVDTFNYFGDLSQLLPLCLAALTKSGWLMFTLEEGPLTEDQYFLQPHGRYVHSPAYLIERLGECGLAGGTIARVVLRKEGDRNVHGLLIAIQPPQAED